MVNLCPNFVGIHCSWETYAHLLDTGNFFFFFFFFCHSLSFQLNCRWFYKKRSQNALIPVEPNLSEDELFDDDDGEDPDYVPQQHDPDTPGTSIEPATKRRRTTAEFGDEDEDDEDEDDEDEDDVEQEEEGEEQQQEHQKSKKGKGKSRGKKCKSAFQTRPTAWKKQDINLPAMPKYNHQPPLYGESPHHYFYRFISPVLIKHIT